MSQTAESVPAGQAAWATQVRVVKGLNGTGERVKWDHKRRSFTDATAKTGIKNISKKKDSHFFS